MNEVPDENDLVYQQYGLDIEGMINWIYGYIQGNDWESLRAFLIQAWNVYSVLAILMSLLFFIGFIYAKIRAGQLSEIEQESLLEAERKWAEQYGGVTTTNDRWSQIQGHLAEENPNSWRVAIIEADIFLEEVLNNAGYSGTTIGEKLKGANPTSFTTVQDAWEAHKIRNEIAHAGGDFILTKRIAQETIVRFERVFREFGAL